MALCILDEARTENLVTFFKGDIPILLTVPHGGTRKPDDIDRERIQEKGYKVRSTEAFSTEADENTYQLAWRLADKIKEKIGAAPYVVAADFERKYIDVDRNHNLMGTHDLPYENHAYDSPAGQKYYERYHEKVSHYVGEINRRFPGEGLLFDIHGSVLKNNRIVVGMVTYDPADFQRNFRRGHVSVDSLIARFGFDPLYHPTSGFLSMLHGKPLFGGAQTEVVPMDRFEKASLSGGFTVLTYGSNRTPGMNAFHLEASQKLRVQWLDLTVEIYAEAIQALYRNIIDAPTVLDTIFAGKKRLGGTGNGKPVISVSFDFDLTRHPKKGYPALINIHTRKVKTKNNPVTLNGYHLGYLRTGCLVTFFEIDNNGWGSLKKKHNTLTIALGADAGNEQEEFDIVKIDLLCFYP